MSGRQGCPTQLQSFATLSAEEQRMAATMGRLIPANEAFAQAAAYQKEASNGIFAVAYSRDLIESLLLKRGSVGIRANYVTGENGKLSLVLTSIRRDYSDILATTDANGRTNGNDVAAGDGPVCPPHCHPMETKGGRLATAGQFLNAVEAKSRIEAFNAANPVGIRAVSFGSKVISDILSQGGAAGIRFYFVKDKDGHRNLMFVGIDAQFRDILTNPNGRPTDGGGSTGGGGMPCPQNCAP